MIVATEMDGQPLALGGLGPQWAVYEADTLPAFKDKPLKERFALCPWGLYQHRGDAKLIADDPTPFRSPQRVGDFLTSYFRSGDAMRSRSVSDVVLSATLDVPAPPARLIADWEREAALHLALEPGDVEPLPLARGRGRAGRTCGAACRQQPTGPACSACPRCWKPARSR